MRYQVTLTKRLPDAPEWEPFSEHDLGSYDDQSTAEVVAATEMSQRFAVAAEVFDTKSDDERVYYTDDVGITKR